MVLASQDITQWLLTELRRWRRVCKDDWKLCFIVTHHILLLGVLLIGGGRENEQTRSQNSIIHLKFNTDIFVTTANRGKFCLKIKFQISGLIMLFY